MGIELPPQKGAQPPTFGSCLFYCGQMSGWIKMPLGTKIGLGQGHIVLHGDPAALPRPHCARWRPSFPPPKKKGHSPPLLDHVYFIVAKCLDGSRCHLVRRSASAKATLCYMGIQLPRKRAQPPNFQPMSVVAKWSPISATADHLLPLILPNAD